MTHHSHKSGTGRHRGEEKSETDLKMEAKAKGHLTQKEQLEKPGEEFTIKDRGHQRGYGKNQGREASDMSTAHGTRSSGSEHG